MLFWNSVRAHYSNWRHRQRPAATGPDVKGFYEIPNVIQPDPTNKDLLYFTQTQSVSVIATAEPLIIDR